MNASANFEEAGMLEEGDEVGRSVVAGAEGGNLGFEKIGNEASAGEKKCRGRWKTHSEKVDSLRPLHNELNERDALLPDPRLVRPLHVESSDKDRCRFVGELLDEGQAVVIDLGRTALGYSGEAGGGGCGAGELGIGRGLGGEGGSEGGHDAVDEAGFCAWVVGITVDGSGLAGCLETREDAFEVGTEVGEGFGDDERLEANL